MIKLVAFDWNGTILSDANTARLADSAVLKHFNFKPLTLAGFRNHFRIPIRDFWLSLGLDVNFFDSHSEEIQKIFMLNYEPKEPFCRTRSGSREILHWLKIIKINSVIFSNHPTGHIQKQLKRLKLENYFTAVLGRDPGNHHMHKRSKGEKLKSFVRSSQVSPSQVLVIGDTDEEIEIGKKLGYTTVALTGGFQSTKILKAAKPDFLIHNFKELKSIVIKLNKT